ncbi:hypothetical protein AAC387_Pa02g1114 [Persea americana]
MPEARDRIPGGGTRGMTLDFGLRPGFDIAALAQPRSGHERALHRFPLSDNKENIPPGSSTSRGRRRTRLRKSPLPSWYPRTPLRDITAIVNAMERRRSRLRAVAELRRRTQESANSSPFPLRTSPLAHELNDSEQAQTPIQVRKPRLSIFDSSPDSSSIMKNSQQPAECPLERPHSSENLASKDKNTVGADKNSDSIDEIGRIVMENFQRMVDRSTKKPKRSTLMSMR